MAWNFPPGLTRPKYWSRCFATAALFMSAQWRFAGMHSMQLEDSILLLFEGLKTGIYD